MPEDPVILKEYKRLKENRGNWNQHYQELGRYISLIKQDFEEKQEDGAFLMEDVFDASGAFAAYNASSALLGMLWSSTADKAISISPPKGLKDPTDEELKWYDEHVTPELTREMDRPEGNLALSLDEYMLDQQIFGTSGIGSFYEDGHLIYRSYGVKEMHIAEGKNSRINRAYLGYEWDAERLVDTYGKSNVSDKVRETYENNGEEKFKIVIAYVRKGSGQEETVHVEHIEKESHNVLEKAEFAEFPIHVARFRKLLTEKYGRSPAMNALPDIIELNVLREAVIVATEKLLDPPLGILSDSMLGNGTVDTSAGAINVFDASGNRGNTPPIFQINTVGELSAVYQRITDLQQSIAQHFAIDRLLDFNNQVAMTATETNERAGIREASLTSLLTRQVVEVFTPMVERSFNLMLRNDRFGYDPEDPAAEVAKNLGEEVVYIPERIAKLLRDGKDSYQVKFTTPADRIASAEEVEGLFSAIQVIQGLMQTHPEAKYRLDTNGVANNLSRLLGNPSDIIKSEEEANNDMKAEQDAMAQQQGLDQIQQGAEIAKTAGEAVNAGNGEAGGELPI